ncbi:hypothetical protein J2S74_004104 [Evansella vedderi]|uniref:Uncharacterized protein n=1 Tax=Evansella vedderi TaxID=38282 RepID=A0ABT9ZZL7_9BACI|nr:hypothetical protein [Evansella vedderi]MDQ0256682.1 hypothetical protein [Evansella vedderi]
MFDLEEAKEMAQIALELTKDELYGNVSFHEQWLNEILEFKCLFNEGNKLEAYKRILESEQLAVHETIMIELLYRAQQEFPEQF